MSWLGLVLRQFLSLHLTLLRWVQYHPLKYDYSFALQLALQVLAYSSDLPVSSVPGGKSKYLVQ